MPIKTQMLSPMLLRIEKTDKNKLCFGNIAILNMIFFKSILDGENEGGA